MLIFDFDIGLLLLCLIQLHFVGANLGVFYSPPPDSAIQSFSDNPVYTHGATVHLQWGTTLETVSLLLCQAYHDVVTCGLVGANLHKSSYNWRISIGQDFNETNVFYFQIHNVSYDRNPTPAFTSHYVNITSGGSSSRASSALITIANPTANREPSSSATQSTHTDALASQSTKSRGQLSKQAQEGIGVGVGLGVSLCFVLGGTILYFYRKPSKISRSHSVTESRENGQDPGSIRTGFMTNHDITHLKQLPDVAEAPLNERRVHELQ
ncbi:hypothetical protein MW887_008615 [Aspergillus wentii]|nr:hypothetical protein MW887_008615 [Aspergillus wentii]